MAFPKNIYGFIALTGGGQGALDAIDGANLDDQDLATGIVGGKAYQYWLDIDSGAAEDPPYVIAPDTNAGDKRWILASIRDFPDELKNLTTAEIQQLENIGATTISGAQWGWLGGYVINAKARAHQSTSQSISDNTGTKVQLQSESYDPGSHFDTANYKYTVGSGEDGYYLLIGNVRYLNVSATGRYTAYIKVNAVDVVTSEVYAASGVYPGINTSTIYYLSANDYVELYTIQTSGSAQSLATGIHNTFLAVTMISP